MAYQAWSVIAGEQPTTNKWNILGTNDASFFDGTGFGTRTIPSTAYADHSIASRSMSADENLYYATADQGILAAGSVWVDVPGLVTASITPAAASAFIRLNAGAVTGGGSGQTTNSTFRVMESIDGGTYADVTAQGGVWPSVTINSASNVQTISWRERRTITSSHSYQYKVQVTNSSGINYGNVYANHGTFLQYEIIS